MLYARINRDTMQMLGEPQELPKSYSPGNGVVIEAFDRLDKSVLSVLGWVPVVYEDLGDGLAYFRNPVPEYQPDADRFVCRVIARDIEQVRAEAEIEIDNAASRTCMKYISTGAGQEMRYLEKHSQAEAYKSALSAGGDPIADDFPMIKLEAEACGVTVAEKADEIVSTRAAWVSMAATVEALRIGGKKAIRGMADPLAVVASKRETVNALEAI